MTAPWEAWRDRTSETVERSPYMDWWGEELRDQPAAVRGPFDARRAAVLGIEGLIPGPADLPLKPGAFPGNGPGRFLAGADLPPPPPPGTPIVAVIDSGIPLDHRRLRRADGTTRILAAWQQDPAGDGSGPVFGQVLSTAGIDRLLADHRIGDDVFAVDQDRVWRVAGLVDMARVAGNRDLMHPVAHGAAVADLAAGHEPDEEGPPLLVVNLPARPVFGLSGALVEEHAILGLDWIVGLSDALWRKSGAEALDGVSGYPIVVCLAYSKQAGSRDGHDPLPAAIRRLNERRADPDRDGGVWSKVHVILPAGNDNLARGHAMLCPEGGTASVALRIPPEDHTSTYLELWSDVLPGPPKPGEVVDLKIAVTPPGVRAAAPSAGCPGQVRDLPDAARIYCDTVARDGGHRVRYVVAIAPTWGGTTALPRARAGTWMVTVEGPATVRADVQVDQSWHPGSGAVQRAYLFDPDYAVVDEVTGRPLDTWDYARPQGVRPAHDGPVVKRRGTLNASADGSGLLTVAAHRLSDDRPADYSGTGATGSGQPSLSVAADRSTAAVGILASGSRDGSRRAVSGTSFACALAARQAAADLRDRPGHEVNLVETLLASDAGGPQHDPPARPEKVGARRILPSAAGRRPHVS
ncbi:MAG: hypothetical protein AAF390_06075 [Pseudomonadota bacterium]